MKLRVALLTGGHAHDLPALLEWKTAALIKEAIAVTEAPAFYDRPRDNPGATCGTVFDWCG